MKQTAIYLERLDHAKNMARYYRLSIVETLFGEFALVREWGRAAVAANPASTGVRHPMKPKS